MVTELSNLKLDLDNMEMKLDMSKFDPQDHEVTITRVKVIDEDSSFILKLFNAWRK